MTNHIDIVLPEGPLLWPFISRSLLVSDLQISLNAPQEIRKQAWSGAKTVARLVERNPHLYIKRVQYIWATGSMCSGSTCIRCPSWMRTVKPPENISVDLWLMMAVAQGQPLLDTSNSCMKWLRSFLSEKYIQLILDIPEAKNRALLNDGMNS